MSAEHRRRYDKAAEAVRKHYFDPLNEFADAAREWVEDAEKRRVAAEVVLEQLRPVWAQGYTSESEAAQASANALSELWQLLHATDQTQAMGNLRRLIAAADAETHYRAGFKAGEEHVAAITTPVAGADFLDEESSWASYHRGLSA